MRIKLLVGLMLVGLVIFAACYAASKEDRK